MSVVNKSHVLTQDGITITHNVPVSSDYMFYAVGSFGGGVLELEASPDGENWFTVERVTQPSRLIRYLVSGEHIRFNLSGATSPNITTGIRQ